MPSSRPSWPRRVGLVLLVIASLCLPSTLAAQSEQRSPFLVELAKGVVFDPTTVKATATPRQPKQFPLGIPYVIVNGKVVVDKGEHTGVLPGRALRYRR